MRIRFRELNISKNQYIYRLYQKRKYSCRFRQNGNDAIRTYSTKSKDHLKRILLKSEMDQTLYIKKSLLSK